MSHKIVAAVSKVLATMSPWASAMAAEIKKVVPEVDTGLGGMASSDGYPITEHEMDNLRDHFRKLPDYTVYTERRINGSIQVNVKADPTKGFAMHYDEDEGGYYLAFFDTKQGIHP